MSTETERSSAGMPVSNKENVLGELIAIRAEMLAAEASFRSLLDQVQTGFRESARNLLHYLALRRRDLRPLQMRLAQMGLSSLGRAESHVLATVDAVIDVLLAQCLHVAPPTPRILGVDFATGEQLLATHTDELLGIAVPGRSVRIMVTMPSEAATDPSLVFSLLQNGMDCMRINCAHDGPSDWSRMIENLRLAEQKIGRSCRVVMDLGGPKLRTGPLEPGPEVIRVRPKRNDFGVVQRPARIWLRPTDSTAPSPTPVDGVLTLPATWLASLAEGERLGFIDARGSRRRLRVVERGETGCWAECSQTSYIVPGTVLVNDRGDADQKRQGVVGPLKPLDNAISLNPGDHLVLTRDLLPGFPARADAAGRMVAPSRIGCTIPGVFDNVKPGEPIWFDDGKIGGVIEKVDAQEVLVRVTHTRIGGGKLRADKGINLPDSDLRLDALTAKDLADLEFVAANADVVELSFANTAEDVRKLQRHLESLGNQRPAIVLKVETRRGFENLPDMLLTAMRAPRCGVMIARGDLAVECGFERLAEVQEEILWISEAAHVPVIWATQVLESLAKEGMPSRAEISDVAMGHRAECVMLNKGPHLVAALRSLDNILRRMEAHQTKKRSILRELQLAHRLPSSSVTTPPA